MTNTVSQSESSFAAKDVPSPLMRQTLLDRELVRPLDRPVIPLLPWLNVVVIGGRSIMDKGRDAVVPVVDELRAALPDHRLLILTGPGIRGRHVLGVGLDLGLPTGVLAALTSAEAEQNGHLIAALLAEQGVSYLSHATIAHQLAVHLAASRAAVSNGYPPYGIYEFPPEVGKIPPHRTDTGAFLLADAYGAARLIYVKDVDGVFTSDPASTNGSSAELIPRIGAGALLARKLDSLPVDALVLQLMAHAKNQKEIQIVNGLTPGNITKALQGEHVGTLVHAD
ncbi:MAG: molybdenum storage protein [Pseudonocardiales bacterium]|jgi:molybdenum storage protein|nr:Molybdenum storage protein subunit alpha [Pseudonocardiales bacterium]MDT7715742.1 molybdenum storage protein [Pseudonocardiales bacterium]